VINGPGRDGTMPTASALDPGSTGLSNPGVDLAALSQFAPFAEYGAIGLRQARGYLYEEWDAPLVGERGRRTIRMMIDGDPVIGAVLHAIEWLARQVAWNVNPASDSLEDRAAAAFLEEVLFQDMAMSWNETLSELISFVGWGWSMNEIVWKPRWGQNPGPFVLPDGHVIQLPASKFDDGRVGLHKIALRSQESLLHWVFDDTGGVRAMVQIPPPDFRRRTVPIEKSLLFRTVVRKGNPEAVPILRNAYEPWFYKRAIQKIEAIGIERDMAGMPVALVPPDYLKKNASADQKALLTQIQTIVKSIRVDEQMGLVFPMAYDRDGHLMFELRLRSTAGARQFNTSDIVDRYDQRIATSMLADFVLVGSKGAGSLALARTKTNFFAVAMGTFLDHIAEVANQHFVPRLMRLNGMQLKALPQIAHSRVAAFPLEDVAAFITALAQAGMPLFPTATGALEKRLLEMADLPVDQVQLDEPAGEEAQVDEGEAVGASEGRRFTADNPLGIIRKRLFRWPGGTGTSIIARSNAPMREADDE
jgi:hypothetical protein